VHESARTQGTAVGTPLLGLLKAPESPDYLAAQRLRLLHTMLVWTFAAAVGASLVNLQLGDLAGASVLGIFSLVCAGGILLNHAGYDRPAALVLCVGVFVAVTAEAYFGGGIHDAGIIVYPVLVGEAAFAFESRVGLWITTVACVLAVTGLGIAQDAGLIVNASAATPARMVVLSAVVVAASGMMHVVRGLWNDNIAGLIDSYDKTLQGWALALEHRDGETHGHCQRVVGMSVALARELGCSFEEIMAVKRGAYLHDIGKMAVPDEILKKPGPLTVAERDVIRCHPQYGRDLIGDVPFLAPAEAIMFAHHECWDGSGYPLGLAGDAIPYGARIFSVIDVWDALGSDRPYRSAWPRDRILAYIAEKSGSQFDPKVVDAFLGLVDREAPATDVPARAGMAS
jgi:putative nucleotidyltransferase with HDIG domain